jgi:type IV pilus assembly protein PilM
MTALERLQSFLRDPPPAHAFEISTAGIAGARLGGSAPEISFQPLPAGALAVSPIKDNVVDSTALQAAVEALGGSETRGGKRRAALILPDYSSRIAILDFDSLPSGKEEQQALVRFRMKKSVPFDVEGAALSYCVQAKAANKTKIEVVVAVTALEIVARYEAPFRAAGFHPGLVTTSILTTLNLVNPDGITVVAKLSGATLTVAVVEESGLKLVRCVELDRVTTADLEPVLLPTLAFVEDELNSHAKRILLCGFGPEGEKWASSWSASWGIAVELMQSRFGAPGELNAGLIGYMESVAA